MTDRVFLTEKRRDVLNGEYEGSDAALRNQKSRLKKSANTALDEVIAVAASGAIENDEELFHPDQIYRLLSALTTELNTFQDADGEPMNPDGPYYREVDRAYRNEILRRIDRLRLEIHGNDRWDDTDN